MKQQFFTIETKQCITQTTRKMKKLMLTLMLFMAIVVKSQAQCNTYVHIEAGVDACMFAVIVSTLQTLTPCSAPPEYAQLTVGDYAYINFTPSSCPTTCMAGTLVDITCVQLITGIENTEAANTLKVFPTLFQSEINIEGNGITNIEIDDALGSPLLVFKYQNAAPIDLSMLSKGVYFVKIRFNNQTIVKKIVKI